MLNIYKIQILVVAFMFTSTVYSELQCLSGKPSQTHLLDQLAKAKKESPVSKLISEKYKLGTKTEADSFCETCNNQDSSLLSSSLKKISTEKTIFKAECVEAAATIKTGSNEISCPDQRVAKHNFCVTKSLMNYQSAVVSEFYKCVKSSTTDSFPMSPEGLFELYSLESGFKPAFTNNGGTGLGQLTGIFIQDLHQAHRGRKLLNTISASNENSCAAAKIILQKDLLQAPSFSNKCNFTQYGEGLERNVLYTIAGLAKSWDKDISRYMKAYSEKYKSDPLIKKAQERALLNAYGYGGNAAARAAIVRLSSLPPKDFIKSYDNDNRTKKANYLTLYTSRMKKKQTSLTALLPEFMKSAFKTEGSSACIE